MEKLFQAVHLNDINKVKDLVLTSREGRDSVFLDKLIRSVNKFQTLYKLFFTFGDEVKNYFKNYQLDIFYRAIRERKNIKSIVVILSLDKDCINRGDKTGQTPLIMAISFDRNLRLIKYLLENNADVNICDGSGKTPLHFARKKDVVKLLIENGANVNQADNKGLTPLLNAVYSRFDKEIILEFIKIGADLEVRNNDGETCLHLALYFKYGEDIINEICSKTCNYNVEDSMGLTPLCHALDDYSGPLRQYQINFLQELIDKGFLVNENVFMHAIKRCKNVDFVLSLAKCVDLKIVDKGGNCLLHHARDVKQIKMFLRRGVPINHKNNEGITPLMEAVIRRKNKDLVESLLSFGAELRDVVNFFDAKKHTHLMVYNTVYDVLVSYGMSVNLKNQFIQNSLTSMLKFISLFWIEDYTEERGLLGHIFLSNENITVPEDLETNDNVNNLIRIFSDELNKMKHEIFINNLSYYDFCMKEYRKIRCPFINEGFTKENYAKIRKLFPTFYNELIVKMTINIKIYKRKALLKSLMNVRLANQKTRGNNLNKYFDSNCEHVTLDYDSMYNLGTFMNDGNIKSLLAAAIIT